MNIPSRFEVIEEEGQGEQADIEEEEQVGEGSKRVQAQRDVASEARGAAADRRDDDFNEQEGVTSEDEPLLASLPASGQAITHQLISWESEDAYLAEGRRRTPLQHQAISEELRTLKIDEDDVHISLEHVSNVFLRTPDGSTLRGMEARIEFRKDATPEQFDRYLGKFHSPYRHSLLTRLQRDKSIEVVILGSQITPEKAKPVNFLRVVCRHTFLGYVKSHWRTQSEGFFDSPDGICDAVSGGEMLSLPFFKKFLKQHIGKPEPHLVGTKEGDLTWRICRLTVTGGFFMQSNEAPVALRSDPGASLLGAGGSSASVARVLKRPLNAIERFRRNLQTCVPRPLQSKGFNQPRKDGQRPKKRRETGQQPGKPAAGGPLQKQAGPGKGGGAAKKFDGSILDYLRQRLPSPNCLTQLLTRDVMLSYLLSPAIAAGQIGANEPPPRTPSEVEERVFSHCVQRRIRELHCGETLSDMTDEAERMRQELTAALPAPGPGAPDSPDEGRYWTATYFLHHASPFDTAHLKVLCSNAHSLMAQLLGRIAEASKERDKPRVTADALADKVLQVITAGPDEGAGEPQTPKAPFASEAHIAIAHAISLQIYWNATRENSPPKDLLLQYLRLKGDATTVIFVTAPLMLRVNRAKPELKRKVLLDAAAYFLSDECSLVDVHGPDASVRSWRVSKPASA
jgi:hypothetical protein